MAGNQQTQYRNTVAGSFRRTPARPVKSQRTAGQPAPGQVRIIAGRWRGRKLGVPDVVGLRPTGDRVRETLFNWLQANVAGAHCLDLFAGSGALGFEALSRYAQTVTFVEPDAKARDNLGHSCRLLDIAVVEKVAFLPGTGESTSPTACLYDGTALSAIECWRQPGAQRQFDLVFIDPPFDMAYQWEVLTCLVPSLLSDGARIYIESPRKQPPPEQLPAGCDLVREKRFGDVVAHLLSYSSPS